MKTMKPTILLMTILSCLAMAACGDGGNNNTAISETGTLSLGLADAATDQYRAIYITVDEVQVHLGGSEENADNWETIAAPMATYNLLELVNGVIEELGASPLETGIYEQMRLIIGTTPEEDINILGNGHPFANYAIDVNSESHKLIIPSAINTGIKIVHDFEISANQTTELILDFNASASVVKPGISNSAYWLLQPTIKVLDTQEHATVSGIVYDSESFGIEGALVSLQYETSDAEDQKDAVTVQAATVSDEENLDKDIESGEYAMLVEPGSYQLVASRDDYVVGCYAVDAASSETTVQDLELATSAMGTVEGNVTITIDGDPSEQYATLSFRQSVTCEGADEESMVEVRSVNTRAGFYYAIDLPVGTYSLVASSEDMETQVYEDIEVTGSVTFQDVFLEPNTDTI